MTTAGVNKSDTMAERACLGACLLSDECAREVVAILRPADYHDPRNALVHEAVASVLASGRAVDTVEARAELAASGRLQAAGGDSYLIELNDTIPHLPNVAQYAVRIRQLAAVRAACHAALALVAEAGEGIEDLSLWLDRAEGAVASAIEHRAIAAEPVSLDQCNVEMYETMIGARAGKGMGHKTGLTVLDKWITGMMPGELVILAGRPGMAKTSLALHIAMGVEQSSKLPVYFQSAEMPRVQLAQRIASADSGVPLKLIREATINTDQLNDVQDYIDRTRAVRIFIDDTASPSIADLSRNARRVKRKHGGLALVVVDYLQLLRALNTRAAREEAVSEVSRALKSLAKELNVAVLALASLNRESEKQGANKRPTIAHIRESGSIESDADTVLLLYREEVVNTKVEDKDKGIAEIIIGKQRSGAIGTIRVAFHADYTRFANLETWRDGQR